MRRLWALVAAVVLVALPVLGAPPTPVARAIPVVDRSGRALAHIRAALAQTARHEEDAVTRIAVFGDSHIACDLFTGALRQRLQDRYGDAGHGFVLLGTAWSLYHPLGVLRAASPAFRVERLRPAHDPEGVRIGIGGAVARASIAGARASATGVASRFELFYERAPGNGRLALRVDGRTVQTLDTDAPRPMAARTITQAADGSHAFEIEALDDRPVAVYGAVLERDRPGVVVDDLGIPGLSAPHLAIGDQALLAQQLADRSPDLVIHAFGTNEVRWEGIDLSTYRATVAAGLRRLRAAVPDASCLVLGPIDRKWRQSDGQWAAPLEAVIERQRGAAADAGCAFWDQRAAMGGPGSMELWMTARPRMTLRDGVHLAARGYDELARALIEVIEGR